MIAETRNGDPCQDRRRILNHRQAATYQNPAPASTPGPILAKHWFRGCELLTVRSDELGGKTGWAS
jgi:hypothetical protein